MAKFNDIMKAPKKEKFTKDIFYEQIRQQLLPNKTEPKTPDLLSQFKSYGRQRLLKPNIRIKGKI